jgi:DNA-binding NtrC family response regulator
VLLVNNETPETVLLIERDVLVRTAVAKYLRGCGYRVIESASSDEALTILQEDSIEVDVAVIDAAARGSMNGFTLIQWLEKHRPSVKTLLVGTPERAVAAAGGLCEEGPAPAAMHFSPQLLQDEIRRLLASRRR